jgi:enoyl-CoA hydratase
MQSLRVARTFPSRFVKTLAPRIQRPYSTPSAEHNYEHIQLSTPRPSVALSMKHTSTHQFSVPNS